MYAFGDTGRPKVFHGIAVVHQSQSDHGIALNEVALNEKDSIRQVSVVDQLDAIFPAAGDDIAADDDIEGGAAV